VASAGERLENAEQKDDRREVEVVLGLYDERARGGKVTYAQKTLDIRYSDWVHGGWVFGRFAGLLLLYNCCCLLLSFTDIA
jgi:hypothetical protein